MKKIKYILVMALLLFVPVMTNVNADEVEETSERSKITIYLFRGEGCPHCAEAEEWFDELSEDKEYSNYYNLVKYEVWHNDENVNLMEKVASKLDTEANGVPFIVIGEKYFSGFSTAMEDNLKKEIKEAYENDDYKDVVASTIEEENLEVTADKKESKITLYLFKGEGCPHCAEAEEWLDELSKDEEYSNYYKVVEYEVWHSDENSKLMDKVAAKLGTEANGVPFIVIGEKYVSGFSSAMEDEIKGYIKDAYDSDNYKDVVASLVESEGENNKEKKNLVVPIVIVSGIALISVIGLVFFTKEK